LLLPTAERVAAACGVTRLAEITRLDRVGLPVWQAVRPLGRALSVHQGKGISDADARLGACMEAIESDHAERFVGNGPFCRFTELPTASRAPQLSDFAGGPATPGDVSCRWAEVADHAGGGTLMVPEALISLDLTRDLASGFERSSAGLACGTTLDDAVPAALREVIERDAFAEWREAGPWHATASAIDPGTVPFDWFAEWHDRLAAQDIAVRCYAVPALTGTPVFACELNDQRRRERGLRVMHGIGCHHDAEIALFRALAEAIQGRATMIAGARDDITLSDHAVVPPGTVMAAFGLPPPTGGLAWRADQGHDGGAAALIARLIDAGYRQIGICVLGEPQGLVVVKAVVPGLGSLVRRRRMVRRG